MMVRRIVSYYARPASFSTGGVNTSRQQWMRAFAGEGLQVEIISAKGGFEEQLVKGDRITFRSITHVGRRRMTMIPLGLSRHLRSDDLVYLHEGWTVSNFVAAIVCRLRKVDYVVMPHGVYSPSIVSALRLPRLRLALESLVVKNARAVHLFFEAEIPELEAVSARATAVVAVTGLDMADMAWDPDTRTPYIAWIGRYDIEHKGIDLLFDALLAVPPEKRPIVRMHGPDHRGDKARVKKLVKSMDLGRWVLVGSELARGEVIPFLSRSMGFVHVPRWEAFGRTIAEAMSVGIPVVLSDRAHIAADLCSAGAARIVSGDDTSQIAAALQELWRGDIKTGPTGREWMLSMLSWRATARNLLQQLGEPFDRGLVVMPDRRKVFLMVTGPYRNIGDSLIRRRAIEWARSYGPLVILMSGKPSRDWDRSLEIQSQDEVVRSRLGWLGRVCGAPAQPTLVIEPGEFNTDRPFLRSLAYVALAALTVKMKGGHVVQLPRSQSQHSMVGNLLYRMTITRGLVYWREPLTARRFGRGQVVPDIGFDSAPQCGSAPRELLVVSLRGDRTPPSHDWTLAVRQFAAEAELRVVILTQVEADNLRSAELAGSLGARLDLWDPAVSSIDRERQVRETYSRAAMVLSDRLHALVIGAVMGAVPIEIVPEPNGKARKHFRAIGLDHVTHDSSALTRDQMVGILRGALNQEAMVTARVRQAASVLRETRLVSERFVGTNATRATTFTASTAVSVGSSSKYGTLGSTDR